MLTIIINNMKDPAFLFYPNDYIGGTMGMTFEEKGAYVDLLMLQFNRGHMTSHMVGQVIGQLEAEPQAEIMSKFKKDEDGCFYNERLELEIEKRKAFVQSRNNNISGTNQYTNKQGKNEGHIDGHIDGHMTSHMEDVNICIEYYNSEISNNSSDSEIENYRLFVDFLFGKNELKEKMTCWLKLKNQLSIEQFKKIMKKSKEKNRKIRDMILSGYNKPQKYLKGNVSFYATLNSWLNRNDQHS